MNRLGTHLEHDWNKLGIGLERTGLEHVIVTIGTGLEHVGTGLERVHDPVHFFVVLVFNFTSEATVVHISFIFRFKIRSCLVAAGRVGARYFSVGSHCTHHGAQSEKAHFEAAQ